MWHLLRSRNAGDLKFRRQHVVGPFVVDFYCPAAKLVVEVDGESHEDPEADARRTAYLEAQGMKVFRVTNDQVLHQRLAVMDAILDVTEERLEQSKNPHPSPLPKRERE